MFNNFKYSLVAVNSLAFPSAVITNVFIIVVILKTPTLHTPSNVLLCSLALSDFGVGLVVQPLFVIFLVTGEEIVTEQVIKFHAMLLIGASVMTMTAIAVDRYLALALHLKYPVIITVRKYVLVLFLIWTVNIISTIACYLMNPTAKCNIPIVSGLVLSVGISSSCYLLIYRIVRRHRRQIRNQTLSIAQQFSSACIPTIRQGRSITAMYYIHGCFVLCCLPYQITLMVSLHQGNDHQYLVCFYFFRTILFLNSAINPYLYCWRMQEIRREVKRRLKACIKM